jgi:hypothetical protein
MTIYLKTSSLAALICCCLISGCLGQDKPAAAPSDTKPSIASPAVTNENVGPMAKNIFQPSAIDPAVIRQSMQARSEYEEVNRKVITRMNQLYEENPEVKELQAKMRELQKKIDALLAEDEELAKLKKKAQSIAPEIPSIPHKFTPPPSAGEKK